MTTTAATATTIKISTMDVRARNKPSSAAAEVVKFTWEPSGGDGGSVASGGKLQR